MFRSQGGSRTDQQNRRLAGYLAFLGGFVNSAGFVLVGSFTSHVTGNVGRLANDVAARDAGAAATVLAMIAGFLAGAFVASMIVESDFFGRSPNAYGVALLVESALLVSFTAATFLGGSTGLARWRDTEAVVLCAAMGMQNSLVTRLSGAVVRTTHLTGVVTDLGIEGARWFRWWRSLATEAFRVKLAFGRNPAERPSAAKTGLLATIAGAFTLGAVLGAEGATFFGRMAMLFPSAALGAGAVYAFRTAGERSGTSIAPGPDSRG
jgi:uncharacterized membrane protein YoaK (UPF0700 family)